MQAWFYKAATVFGSSALSLTRCIPMSIEPIYREVLLIVWVALVGAAAIWAAIADELGR